MKNVCYELRTALLMSLKQKRIGDLWLTKYKGTKEDMNP